MTCVNIQIRFADVDSLGHVNNVNLQHYFDLGKNYYFRDVLHIGIGWKKIGPITAATNTSYFEQTRLDDDIRVETEVEKVGNKSMIFQQRIIHNATGKIHSESRSVMVAFDFERQESVPVPDDWRKIMEEGVEISG